MEFLHAIEPVYVLAGFLVGALVGVTGVGGGALMTPILIFFGIPPVAAVGTDLLYASLTKAGGTFVHGYNHTVDWRVVVRLATGSIPAAALTLLTLYELHIGSDADPGADHQGAGRRPAHDRAGAAVPQAADPLLRPPRRGARIPNSSAG